ncbi:MAG: CoA pyrophosphatase [Clostridiales Family XIII bacterium]|nr:CoA pyrophosphatase [Clostridiales Family XIII bacterium]
MITREEIENALRNHAAGSVSHTRDFSVLLPLVEKDGELHILYEVRSDDLDVQPGEVSFPGGAVEDGETLKDAAVRETSEELGILPGEITVLAELNYLVTYSNFTLYCFLGEIPYPALAAAEANRAEVKETFLVPLSFFCQTEPEIYFNRLAVCPDPNFPTEKISAHGGYTWRTGTNEVMIYTWKDAGSGKEYVIWGMTAKLTWDFVRLLRLCGLA